MRFRWEYPKDYRSDVIKQSSIFERIKKRRGYSREFLQSDLNNIPDFNLLKDIDKAADRIIKALSNKEKIMIYGHDDLDGITSTYILFDYLEKIGYQNHFYYIPNRKTDNHGIQPKLINRLIDDDFTLLITVDGGISDFDAIETLVANDIDVIITDHHMVQDRIPNAVAVVNPKQQDCRFPFKMIAGVAVVYFLLKKLENELRIAASESYLFWVAMGTISDKVPLQGVNRSIIKKALDNWLFFNDFNLKVLHEYMKHARNETQKMVVMKNLIKLFSNGRLPDGENKTLNFLLSSEDKKSEILLEFEENLQSQEEVVKKGINFFQSIDVGEDDLCYLYFDKNNLIPSEVMGLVASYIVNYYKIPALILKEKNGIIGCEARSTEGLNLVKAFDTCSKHLIQYGGHAKAAGFTCEKANVSSFERSFLDHLESIKTMIEECKVIEIDAILEYDKINELNNYLETDYHFLQPYGEGNLSPIFLIKNYDLQSNQLNIHDDIDNDEVYKADIIIQRSGNGFNLIDYDVLNRSKNEN